VKNNCEETGKLEAFKSFRVLLTERKQDHAQEDSRRDSPAARGIEVTNTPDVVTDETADIAILLLAASRRASEREALVRSGRWRDPKPLELLGWPLTGKALGTATVETRIRIGMRALDNLDAALASGLPKVLVTPIVVSQH
jgi:lactate dehydrogenase-like 2-hydroxyacid dehydrogenase